jgi:RNA-directed DNA polymerase
MMNRWFEQARLQQHPDKTFIGRISKGFNWLGYLYNQNGLVGIAPRSSNNFSLKLHRLYEQARGLHLSKQETRLRVVDYIKRWQQWSCAGITFAACCKSTNYANDEPVQPTDAGKDNW